MLQQHLLQAERTKQSAHSNVLIGKVVSVRNPIRDGEYLEPLWNVAFTSRRGVTSTVYDLRSAVPLRVGHEVFFIMQDGDPLRGGFILGQTTDPIQWSDRELIFKYDDDVWNEGATSTLALGKLTPFTTLSQAANMLIAATEGANNPMIVTDLPDRDDWRAAGPDVKYVQSTFEYVVPRRIVELEVTVRKTAEQVWALTHESNDKNGIGAVFSDVPGYLMRVSLGYAVRGPGNAPYVIEFPIENREIFSYELRPSGLGATRLVMRQQSESVVDEHPIPGGVVKKTILTEVDGFSNYYMQVYQSDSEHSFTTTLDLTGNVGRTADLFVAVELYSRNIAFPLLGTATIESSHRLLVSLGIEVREVGTGSALRSR